MIRTGIPAAYWHTCPAAEVATAMEILRAQSGAGPPPGEVLVSGGR